MADRGATAAVLDQISADSSAPIHLVEVHLDSATIYLTDGYRSVGWNGNTYLAQGHLLEFDGLDETLDFQLNELTGKLTGADQGQTWPALALAEEWVERRIVIYRAFTRDDGEVIPDPVPLFDGALDEVGIEDDPDSGDCTVTVRATNHFGDFGRRPGRRTNDTEQQAFFPGDPFYQFTSEQNRTLHWGGTKLTPSGRARFRWALGHPEGEDIDPNGGRGEE